MDVYLRVLYLLVAALVGHKLFRLFVRPKWELDVDYGKGRIPHWKDRVWPNMSRHRASRRIEGRESSTTLSR